MRIPASAHIAVFKLGLIAVVGLFLSFPGSSFTQDINLDDFEEVDATGTPIAPSAGGSQDDPTAEWEEVSPQQNSRSAERAPELDSVNLNADPAPPPRPAARPPVNVPVNPQAGTSGDRAVGVQRQVAVPTGGISLDGDFQDQIRALNQEISVLKERVIEAKSRLLSYSQKVAQGFASGTQLYMKVQNNLGRKLRVERLAFYLDGHQIYTREFEEGEEFDELLAYKGSVLPGRHRIDVDAVLRGDDGLFDFSYKARLRLESGEYFAANEGKVVELDLVMFDQGGMFTSIEARPGLRFEIVERDVF